MGMDVYGLAPRSEVGEYFRNNIWGWPPLWGYVIEVTGELLTAEQKERGYNNSGVEVNNEQAVAIADELERRIASGEVSRRAAAGEQDASTLGPEPPMGAWIRETAERLGVGVSVWPQPRMVFEVANVQNFAAFARDCGGFSVQ